MSVYIRKKKLTKGRNRLYLDYYPPLYDPNSGKSTRREFLNLFLYDKPKTEEQKDHNKDNKIIAEKIRNEREIQIRNEEFGIFFNLAKKVSFNKYFKKIVEEKISNDGNYGNWSAALKYFDKYSNSQSFMGDINVKMCNDYKNYLLSTNSFIMKGKKLSSNSASSYFSKFLHVVDRAYKERYLSDNPAERIDRIKLKEGKRDFLTLEELQKLVETDCENPELKKASLFSALTGLRWSDVVRLRWVDIEHSKEQGYYLHLSKEQKTEKPLFQPISSQAVELLGGPGIPEDFIFSSLEYSSTNNQKLAKWVNKAGINKHISFHNFRHTYATLLLNNGVDIYTVSKMLNHRKVETTQIYAKVLDKKKQEAASVIKLNINTNDT